MLHCGMRFRRHQERSVPVSDIAPVRWQPDRANTRPPWPVPRVIDAMWRGALGKCPACGVGRLFRGYLKVADTCAKCPAPLGLARADDAPPYFTIILVGHIVVPSMLILERAVTPPLWVHSAIWVPLTIALALALLRPIKGATLGALVAFGKLVPDGHE